MSVRVKLSLVERFLNWYPSHTTLYFRRDLAEKKAERAGVLALSRRHADQLTPFFSKVQAEIDEAYTRGYKDGYNDALAGEGQ